ncbi:guanine nucleotide exchange protein SMCR8-like isoform X3 [Biomphalaria glabrata]|nr:guanine nucleotide exchange protein SMCR8-like isoform X3 [Biomphalaria glabrata]XP_055889600.1 guanine nucleotide exchange protein SMCR8-like isoform X3 [Biomphalaria glabrata]XP_055889601.1 guanine nucleotide exchange protein SMCR8-like isoform X3 [Biomphalaria glabrata]
MFGEYAQIATYLQQTRDGAPQTAQECLPPYLCPTYSPPQLYNIGREKKNNFEDFILIAEFSELEGPKPVMTIPKEGGAHIDQNAFAVKILAVDFQTSSEGFSITEDAQVLISDTELGIHAFVHHLILYDNTARGFVRPYCITYITTEQRKLLHFYEDISLQFKKAARYLKYGNKIVFVGDLERHLKDLEHTKGYLLNQVSKMRLKDDLNENQVNEARKNAENEMYRTLQTIRQSSTEIKEIISILKPLLNDRRLEAKFRELEDKAFQQTTQAGEDKLSLQDNWFNDLSSIEECDLRSGSLNESKVSPLTLFKPRDYKPLLVETKKAKRFNAPLRGLHELCSWGAKEGLKKFRNIHDHFKKEAMVLDLERNESRMLRPRCTSLSHGHCVTGNFLSDVYMKNVPNCVTNEFEGWSMYSGHQWGSSASLESLDSFKSADDGSLLSLNTFNSAESIHSFLALDISLLAETEYYPDVENFNDINVDKNGPDTSGSPRVSGKSSLKSNLSMLSICKTSDLDFTDSQTIVEDDSEYLFSEKNLVEVNTKVESSTASLSSHTFPKASQCSNIDISSIRETSDVSTHLDSLPNVNSHQVITFKNIMSDKTNHIKCISIPLDIDDSSSIPSDISVNEMNSLESNNTQSALSPSYSDKQFTEELVTFRENLCKSEVPEIKGDGKSKLSTLLDEEDNSKHYVKPGLQFGPFSIASVEEISSVSLTPSSDSYQTPSDYGCSFLKLPNGIPANMSQLAQELNGLRNDYVSKFYVEEDDTARYRAESDTSSAFTEISLRDLFSYRDNASDHNKNHQLQTGKDISDGISKGKQFYEDVDSPVPCASVWKPRCRLYTLGEWISNSSIGKPGSCILEVLSSYQNLHHIIYSLLSGRPVLIAASVRLEQEVIKLVRALTIFVPMTKRKRQNVLEWTSKPLSIVDLAKLKLVGICRPDKRSLDSFIPCAVKKTCCIVDLEKRVIIASPYQGFYISAMMSKRKLFKTDVQYLSYIHWWLMELAAKAFLFFHSFCLSSTGSILYSLSPRDQHDPYSTTEKTESTIMTKLGIRDCDCEIIQHFSELVKLSKIESKICHGTDSGSIVYPFNIQHKVCQTYRC